MMPLPPFPGLSVYCMTWHSTRVRGSVVEGVHDGDGGRAVFLSLGLDTLLESDDLLAPCWESAIVRVCYLQRPVWSIVRLQKTYSDAFG